MTEFIHAVWPSYVIFGGLFFVIAGGIAVGHVVDNKDDDVRKATFWMVSALWWPLVVLYYILKAVFFVLKTAYEGMLLTVKGK